MKHSTRMKSAEKYRKLMQNITDSIASEIKELIGDDGNDLYVLYQSGDGWVIMFGDAHNAMLSFSEFDELFKLSPQNAREFLWDKRV